jgi:hypothetical protein
MIVVGGVGLNEKMLKETLLFNLGTSKPSYFIQKVIDGFFSLKKNT